MSLEIRVLRLLVSGARSKADLSRGLGNKEISGQLNKVIRMLVAEQQVEPTIPDKPNSRLQRYRLTPQGEAYLKANPYRTVLP